jgi:BirA family biotin operon repressor/biotin-[acetyl-CoA-carboxylase] ligase
MMFDVDRFHQLRKGKFGEQLHYFTDVDSTNRVATDLARRQAPEGSIVLAEAQTNGRGRNDRTWFSPSKGNLYFTVILYPPDDRLHYLPYLCGLSVVFGLQSIGAVCDLKWPNDLFMDGKKAGGILIQTSVEENRLRFAVAGMGLNVNMRDFPSDLRPYATSVASCLDREVERENLLTAILWEMEKLYGEVKFMAWDHLSDLVLKHSSFVKGCEVIIDQNGKRTTGTTGGLDFMGGLIVRTTNGAETFYTGEITSCRRK